MKNRKREICTSPGCARHAKCLAYGAGINADRRFFICAEVNSPESCRYRTQLSLPPERVRGLRFAGHTFDRPRDQQIMLPILSHPEDLLFDHQPTTPHNDRRKNMIGCACRDWSNWNSTSSMQGRNACAANASGMK